MGGFEFHVVAEHRGELLRGDVAVVRPRREVVVSIGVVVAGWGGFRTCLALAARWWLGMLLLFLALAWALLGVLRELEIIELIGLTFSFLTLDWRRTSRFRIPKKVALQGQVRLGHGRCSDQWIVRLKAAEDVAGSPQAVKLDSKVGQGSWCM
jgi:hypothetical protein